jgi:hypothetical protein
MPVVDDVVLVSTGALSGTAKPTAPVNAISPAAMTAQIVTRRRNDALLS